MPSNEKYEADRGDNKKQQENESSKKATGVAAKAAIDYFTGGQGGKIYDAAKKVPVVGKTIDKAEEKLGEGLNKATGGKFGKIAKKADDVGALDAADKALSLNVSGNASTSSVGTQNTPGGSKSGNSGGSSTGTDSSGSSGNKSQGNSGLGKNKGIEKENENELTDSNDSSGDKSETDADLTGKAFGSIDIGKIKIILIASGIIFFILLLMGIIVAVISPGSDGSKEEEDTQNGTCTYTQNADIEGKQQARFTSYYGKSLGGSIGDVSTYIKEGTVFFEDGYAMWRGGTKSKANGQVYGQPGIDYMIVAMATKMLIGKSSGGGYTWQEDNNIKYYSYGDTFSIINKFGDTEKVYNAIVLDSCGACMEWSLTYPGGRYSPNSTNANEKSRCEVSEGYKIDLYTYDGNVSKRYSDMGYIVAGNTNNTCVGEVDLGDLVTGIQDTKLLQGQSIRDLYGDDGLQSLNDQIKSNVQKYGEGTGKGVAAAAITLINSLKSNGYRLPYYWAGGHGGGISDGVKPSWGSNSRASCINATCYYYDSLDCSGFVSWSIHNGGCTNYKSALDTSSLINVGQDISIEEAKAGDILVYRDSFGGHTLLVVQNNAGNVILAESSGGTGGVHYSEYNTYTHGKYHVKDMSSFYASNQCK